MKNILTTCLFLCLLLTGHAADNPNVKKLFTVTSGELKLTLENGDKLTYDVPNVSVFRQDTETYRFMVDFFETHTDQELRPLQTARTDLLQKSYATKKSLSVREFLVWMCHNAELFKGYSMTVYSYYVSLLNEAFQYYQKQTEQDLMLLLERSSYSRWKQTEQDSKGGGNCFAAFFFLKKWKCVSEHRGDEHRNKKQRVSI